MLRTRMHLLFLFCAIGTAIFLTFHMVVQHLNIVLATGDPDPTSWTSMLGRATQRGWVYIYILLLVFVLFHALYGLRGIVLEIVTTNKSIRVINWVFILGGIIIFAWASYVPVFLLAG
jgi:succinate dehydrogenase hydrophobic anchor subunit